MLVLLCKYEMSFLFQKQSFKGSATARRDGMEWMLMKKIHYVPSNSSIICLQFSIRTIDLVLQVAATFVEVTSREETKEAPSLPVPEEQMLIEKEKTTNIRAAKSPRYFSSETLNLDQLLRLANAENKLAVYGARNQNISESLREIESTTEHVSTPPYSLFNEKRDTVKCLTKHALSVFTIV